MRFVTTSLAALAAALALVACTPYRQQEEAGLIIGTVVGGILGAQVGGGSGRDVATVIGAMTGAVVGGNIGRFMDRQDRIRTGLVLENVRTGVPSQWRNPDTGHQYTVTPIRAYQDAGTPCREYTVDAVIGGRAEKVYGTACRQADGSWRATNN